MSTPNAREARERMLKRMLDQAKQSNGHEPTDQEKRQIENRLEQVTEKYERKRP